MDNKMKQLIENIQQSDGGHILYCFNELESYIENEATFIITGVQQGDHILVVENDRIFPFVYKKLQLHLNEEQLEQVHLMNNFDFYCFYGDFHPSTMVDYFLENIDAYTKRNQHVRTWGHVEWGHDDQVSFAIGEYEKGIDKLIKERGLISVCAYDDCRVPAELKTNLIKHHGILITDEKITILANR
ncbi:MEDS domain-containing protein [Peribacillus frigoritolerans]|uniref:MEDS domain-containing protein n=1 Tax=Peribacillus frigoritolerans TaxID=450367 RepID=UPI002B242A34|nr:MEDS domain-containing protein [Peribacillus frigoritolerans]MEB2493672.1 MEDS domain-containing protein [Peribacillus frigoritolerans]